jgi:hypothetical protein
VPLKIELDETSPGGCGLHRDRATFSVDEGHLRRLRVKSSIDNDAIVTELIGNVVGDENLPGI